MQDRILIAYSTRAGSTKQVAAFIGRVLREAGAQVDVGDVKRIHVMRPYDSVILGTAIRHAHIIPETMAFARRFRAELGSRPTAYFAVCLTMVEDTERSRSVASAYLDPLREIKEPVSVGLFAGKMDHSKLEPLWRTLLSYMKDGPMAGGDYRDWDAIYAWANALIPLLIRHPVPLEETEFQSFL